jgi:hypothetical protein
MSVAIFRSGCCPEVAIEQLPGRRAYFSQIRAVATPLGGGSDQAFLPYRSPHDLLRYRYRLPALGGAYPTIAIATAIELEEIRNGPAQVRIFVSESSRA